MWVCSFGDRFPIAPDGGNFVGMDGAYQQGVLSQTITGLTAGTFYYLSFDFAGAQQYGFTSATTEQFAVDFTAGSTAPAPTYTCNTTGVQCTTVLHDKPEGFTGWNQAGFTFLATSSTETLSFLAIGTPAGQPPFSLLDGVELQVSGALRRWSCWRGLALCWRRGFGAGRQALLFEKRRKTFCAAVAG